MLIVYLNTLHVNLQLEFQKHKLKDKLDLNTLHVNLQFLCKAPLYHGLRI